jgi:PPK2 family polyphosphate:nucleotide phosphotransferase
MSYSIPVEPGSKVNLTKIDPAADGAMSKAEGVERTAKLIGRLDDLQQELYAASVHSVLVVLQGMDTSGKDGTISHVFQGVNPLGVKVTSFKAPSQEELDHDFLWRVHRKVPAAGEIGIFNRSHYESVLVERVHDLVPAKVWKARYTQINDFERLLAESGTSVLKFFLYIDRDEQRRRLLERLAEPAKSWKFSASDLDDRKRWDAYMAAYEEAVTRTSTGAAPWFVVPANKKWYRNLVVASVLVQTLEGMQLHYRKPAVDLRNLEIE